MKIGLYCSLDNGDVIDKDIDYIAVDNGLSHLHHLHIQPICAIGDFDSLEDQNLLHDIEMITLPVEKDVTDTQYALEYVLKLGYDEIDIYGVIGNRMDHFFAVMCLLFKYKDIKITLYDTYNKIRLLSPGHHTIKSDYYYFSLFTIHQTSISIRDAYYPLDHYLLKYDDPLCVSNQTKHGIIDIDIDNDVILIESYNKV